MTATPENPKGLSVLDRPNSYIGKTVPRPNLDRLMQGRGLYVSDVELPGRPAGLCASDIFMVDGVLDGVGCGVETGQPKE